jgi:hypothetical protein
MILFETWWLKLNYIVSADNKAAEFAESKCYNDLRIIYLLTGW